MTPRQLAWSAMAAPLAPNWTTGRTTEVGFVMALAPIIASIASTIGSALGFVGVSAVAQEVFGDDDPKYLVPTDEQRFAWLGATQANYAGALSKNLSPAREKRLTALLAMANQALLRPELSFYEGVVQAAVFERLALKLVAEELLERGVTLTPILMSSINKDGQVTPTMKTPQPMVVTPSAQAAEDKAVLAATSKPSWSTVAIVAASVAALAALYYLTR